MSKHRDGDRAATIVGSVTGCARYIGRVGALAVALGIGVAVATTPGIAWATPDPGSPAADGSAPSTGEHDATTDDTPDTGTLSTDSTPPSTGSSPTATSPNATPVKPDPRDGIVQATGGLNTTVAPSGTTPSTGSGDAPSFPEVSDVPEPTPPPDTSGKDTTVTPPLAQVTGKHAPTARPDTTVKNTTSAQLDSATTDFVPRSLSTPTVSPPPDLTTPSPTLFAAPVAFEALVTADATPSTALVAPSAIPPAQVQPQVDPIAAIVGPFVSLATGLFGLGPALIANPLAPLDPTFGWVVLAFARRQFEQTLFNQSPSFTYGTIDTSQSDTRVITGIVVAEDPDGDPLGYRIVDGPADGDVTIDALTGEFTYTPDAELAASGGTDTFTVAASELNTTAHFHGGPIAGILAALTGADRGDTAVAAVTVTVLNDPPDAVDDTATVTEDTETVIDVLANDTDPENDPITITAADTTSTNGGTVAITDGGTTLTYTPGADFSGTDTFTYTINGGDTATVSVTVNAVNDPPTANPTVGDPDLVTGEVTGNVNGADVDDDASTLTYQVTDDVDNGTLTLNADGSFTYTPTQAARLKAGLTPGDTTDDFDDFTVTVSDPHGATSAPTTITVPIDPAEAVVTASVGVPGGVSTATALQEVGVNPDGTRVYFQGGSSLVKVLDTDTNTLLADIPAGKQEFSPDGSLTYRLSGQIEVIDTATGTVLKSFTIPDSGGFATDFVISPDGETAYVVARPQIVHIIDITNSDSTTTDVVATISLADDGLTNFRRMAINADGSRVYVTAFTATSGPPVTVVIDTTDNTFTTVAVGDGLNNLSQDVVVSPDGTRVYVLRPATLEVIDADTDTLIDSIPLGTNSASDATFSPDGSLIYLSEQTAGGRIVVVDTATGTVLTTIDLTTIHPNNSPLGVQFTADGRAYTVGVVGSFGNASVSEISIVSTTPPVV